MFLFFLFSLYEDDVKLQINQKVRANSKWREKEEKATVLIIHTQARSLLFHNEFNVAHVSTANTGKLTHEFLRFGSLHYSLIPIWYDMIYSIARRSISSIVWFVLSANLPVSLSPIDYLVPNYVLINFERYTPTESICGTVNCELRVDTPNANRATTNKDRRKQEIHMSICNRCLIYHSR